MSPTGTEKSPESHENQRLWGLLAPAIPRGQRQPSETPGEVRLTQCTFLSIDLIFDCILVNYPCSCILTALFTAVKQNVCIANGKDSNFSYVYPK